MHFERRDHFPIAEPVLIQNPATKHAAIIHHTKKIKKLPIFQSVENGFFCIFPLHYIIFKLSKPFFHERVSWVENTNL